MPIARFNAICAVCGSEILAGTAYDLVTPPIKDAAAQWTHPNCAVEVHQSTIKFIDGAWTRVAEPAKVTRKKERDKTDPSEMVVTNLGPIVQFRAKIPETGGVLELRGDQGVGKSTFLQATEQLVTKNGKVTVNDAAETGTLSAFGATLKVTRRATVSGELVVESLSGKFAIADFVDPKILDPEKADAERMRALASMLNVEADVTLFEAVAGGREKLVAIAKPTSLKIGDLLEMSRAIKRDFDAAGLKAEEAAKNYQEQERSELDAAGAVDVEVETDSKVLQDAFSAAVSAREAVKAEQKQADTVNLSIDDAIAELTKIGEPSQRPDFCDIENRIHDSKTSIGNVNREIDEIIAKIAVLQAERKEKETVLAMETQRLKAAEESYAAAKSAEAAHEQANKRRADLEAAANRPKVVFDAGRLAEAQAAVDDAQKLIELGAAAREAKKHLEAASKYAELAEDCRIEGESYRNAAKGCEQVISTQISRTVPGRLQVKHGRLVTTTPTRGETLVGELSHGELVLLALDIVVPVLQETTKKPLIVIPQELWAALTPHNRQLTVDRLAGSGVVAITAIATDDGPLVAEALTPSAAGLTLPPE